MTLVWKVQREQTYRKSFKVPSWRGSTLSMAAKRTHRLRWLQTSLRRCLSIWNWPTITLLSATPDSLILSGNRFTASTAKTLIVCWHQGSISHWQCFAEETSNRAVHQKQCLGLASGTSSVWSEQSLNAATQSFNISTCELETPVTPSTSLSRSRRSDLRISIALQRAWLRSNKLD